MRGPLGRGVGKGCKSLRGNLLLVCWSSFDAVVAGCVEVVDGR